MMLVTQPVSMAPVGIFAMRPVNGYLRRRLAHARDAGGVKNGATRPPEWIEGVVSRVRGMLE
jgi:hypothetical protein